MRYETVSIKNFSIARRLQRPDTQKVNRNLDVAFSLLFFFLNILVDINKKNSNESKTNPEKLQENIKICLAYLIYIDIMYALNVALQKMIKND